MVNEIEGGQGKIEYEFYFFFMANSYHLQPQRKCPKLAQIATNKSKFQKFPGVSPLDPIGGLTAPLPPNCCKLNMLPTGAPLVLLDLLTSAIHQVLLCICRSLCGRPEPKRKVLT